ncbi:MAG: outer membrane efflux [Prolixibacteraceae bacterium]|nr:MAG: outer membrane efflux [Prolixibacteraceae bacterium]
MFGKIKQTLIALLMIPAGIINAQEPLRLTLEEAVKMAMEKNTSILNSKIDLEMSERKIRETIAMGLPHLDLKSAYTFLPKVPTMTFGFPSDDPNAPPPEPIELGVKHNVTTDITASQLIFNGSYIVGLQATKVLQNLAVQNDEKTRLDVNESVINTYQMIQLAEESVNILQQNLDNVLKTKSEISEMYIQGFMEKTDVDQLEVTANVLRNSLKQVETNIDMAYRLLKIQLGIDESVPVAVADSTESYESLMLQSDQIITEEFMLEKNVDYKLVQTSKQLAELNVKNEKSSYLPVITGFYNYTHKMNAPAFDFAPKNIFGINMNLPIFASGQRKALIDQRELEVEKSENTRLFVSNSLVMQANQLKSDVEIKAEKYKNQKQSKELTDEIYQRTLEKYRQGMATSLDLANTQNQYLGNLTSYYQYMFDLQGAITKLEKLYNINQVTQ